MIQEGVREKDIKNLDILKIDGEPQKRRGDRAQKKEGE